MASTGHLFLLVTLLLILGKGCESRCSSNQVSCKTDGRCINLYNICDRTKNCNDGSDENPTLCGIWRFERQYCSSSNIYCNSNCYSYSSFCNMESCASKLNPRVCKIVNERTLDIEEESGMELTDDTVALMTSVVNSTASQRHPKCPMLYTRVGNRCLAFFSLAKVPWSEARQFCKSIFGDLVSFENMQEFVHITDYLKETLLTSDFWIGGRFDMDLNAWSWVGGKTPMPLGTPYWSQSYSSTCVRRPPPNTNPFSDPPDALPGAPCYNYLQAPRQRQQGWCSAMTYEHFYYISDESCQDARSPICVLTYQPQE